jgi:hypothetical protein
LSHTSIANADVVSINQVPIYSPEAYMAGSSQRTPHAAQLMTQIEFLNAQALIVSSMLANVFSLLDGVPLTIAQSCLNAAKGMILGSW